MDAPLSELLALAFRTAPAASANAAIAEVRESHPGDRPTSYEVLVKPEQTLAQLAEAVLPKLVYHLESIGSRPPGCGDVVLSLFVGETLHFVHARDGVPLLAQAMGVTIEEALARFGTGELRHAIVLGETPPAPKGPPLMLPGAPKPKDG